MHWYKRLFICLLMLILPISAVLVLFLVCLFFFGLYLSMKLLQCSIDNACIFGNKYNKLSLYTLDKYGDFPIVKAYIVRKPIDTINRCYVVLFSLLPGILKKKKSCSRSWNTPVDHTALYLELEKPNGHTCMVCVDKDPSIRVLSKFQISHDDVMIPLQITAHKYTLTSMLDNTRTYMKDNLFFNWELTSNHCENFVYELVRSLNNGKVSKKYKSIIDDGCAKYFYDELTEMGLYTIHSVFNLHHIIQNGFTYMKLLSFPF